MKYILLVFLFLLMTNFAYSGNKELNVKVFQFKESETTACFTCSHVINDKSQILYVTHDSDGTWQFLCGNDNHTENNAKIVSLKQIVEIDQSLNNLYEMPKGVGATRKSIDDTWSPFRIAL